MKGLFKESRDKEIKSYRKMVRFLKYFKFHKSEPYLEKWSNILYVYHSVKLRIKREVNKRPK